MNSAKGYIMKAIISVALLGANAAAEEIYPFKAGKWGYLSEQGKVVIEPQFDDVELFSEGIAAAKKGEKWGLIDTKGNWVAEPQFDKLEHYCDEIWLIDETKDGKRLFSYINSKGKMIIKPSPNTYLACTGVNGMLVVNIGHNHGLLDKDGVEILKFEYERIDFREQNGVFYGVVGYYKQGERSSRYGVLDEHGKWILKPEFHWIDIKNHYALLQKEGKWGFYDLKNRETLADFVWDDKSDGYEGTAGRYLVPVWQRLYPPQDRGYKEYGLISREYGFVSIATGRSRIIAPTFDKIEPLSEGMIAVRGGNGKWGFVDEEAKVAIKPRFEEVLPFKNGLASVKFEGKWGCIDKKGKWAIAPTYSEIGDFDEKGFAPARTMADSGGKWGFINKNGEWAITPAYSKVGVFDADGLAPAAVIIDDHHAYGVIDRAGEWVVHPNPKFENIGSFTLNGLARAGFLTSTGWIYGYINKKGEWAIKPRYRGAGDFNDCGIAFVNTGGAMDEGYIDSRGRSVRLPKSFSYYNLNKYCSASQGAFVTADGSVHPNIMNLLKNNYIIMNESFSPKVEIIGVWDDGHIAKTGLIDAMGNVLIKPMPDIFFKNPFSESDFARIYRIINNQTILGIINIKGEFVFDFGDYDIDHKFCEKGLARIQRQKDGKWGLINREYKIVVEPQYDGIHYDMMCYNNLFLAEKKDEKTGFRRQYWLEKDGAVRFHVDKVGDKYILKNAKGEILWQTK